MTLLLAIWGAIVATGTLAWQIWNVVRQEKPRAKVFAMLAVNSNSRLLVLHVRVVNIGKQPLVWSGWALATDRPSADGATTFLIHMSEPQKKLLQNEVHAEHMDSPLTLPGEITRIWAWDSTGREWELDEKQLAKVNDSIRQRKAKTDQRKSASDRG